MASHPNLFWAQRAGVVYLTVRVSDLTIQKLDVTANNVSFSGVGGDKKQYEFSYELYAAVKPDECKQQLNGNELVLALVKEQEDWWPRLVKASTKNHFIRVDFNKWVDEDEEEENPDAGAGGGFDMSQFADLQSKMGGMGMGGMGGMGGMDFGGAGDDAAGDEHDSDDEEMPELKD